MGLFIEPCAFPNHSILPQFLPTSRLLHNFGLVLPRPSHDLASHLALERPASAVSCAHFTSLFMKRVLDFLKKSFRKSKMRIMRAVPSAHYGLLPLPRPSFILFFYNLRGEKQKREYYEPFSLSRGPLCSWQDLLHSSAKHYLPHPFSHRIIELDGTS